MPDIADVAWSEHDERNSEAVPNGWPTGAFPAYTDQVGQMMMGATKRFWNKINPVYQTTGTGDNYVVQTEIGIDQINLYEILCIRIDRSNTTTTPTLQFGATNARTIVKAGPSGYVPLAAGDMFAGNSHTFWYNGEFYILVDPAIIVGSTVQPYSPNLTSWAAITRATGFDTWVASPTSANLAALVGDETGTGALVFGAGPTLSAPLLAGGTSGTTILQASANASGTLTFPAATDTLVGRATTDTLTNKTISGTSNTITNVSLTTGVTGLLPLANLTLGTSGYALVGNGAGASSYQGFLQSGTGAVTRTWQDKASDILNVKDFGAKGDTIPLFDGAISTGTTAFSSASASFTSADVGKLIRIVGAGSAGGVLETTIAARVSSTQVTTSAAASTTVTGATTYYGSDDTAAIQAAVNSILIRNNPARIILPGLIFMTTSAITVPQFTSLSMGGKGVSSVSNLGPIIMPSVTTDGLVCNSSDALHLEGFEIGYAGAAASNKAAIRISPPAGQFNYYSRVRNLTISNAYDGIIANEVVHSVFDGNLFVNFSHTGITRTSALGSPVGDSGDNKFSHNFFQIVSGSPVACFYWTGGGGDNFVNNKCMLAQFGVYLNPATNVNTSQINISNNSFDGVTTAGVQFSRQDGTSALSQLVINANTFNLYQNVAAQAVKIPTDASGTALSLVTISGNAVYTPTGTATNAFGLNAVSGLYIGGNTIVSNNAGTNGIAINSTVANSVLGPNTYVGTFALEWYNSSSTVRLDLPQMAPQTFTGTSGSLGLLANSYIFNASGTFTLGLPSASQSYGRMIRLKSIAAFAVNSAASNVVPLAGGAAGTAILAATAGKWAEIQSDGTNWVIIAAN